MTAQGTLSKGKLISVLLVFVLLSCLTGPVVFGDDPEAESGTTMENFTIYEYGSGEEALSWELSGNRGRETDSGLVVSGFALKLTRSEELVSLFTGKKLRLEDKEGERIAYMPERISLDLKDGMKGSAGEARYYFSEREFSGTELSLSKTGESGEIKLSGKKFSYSFGPEKLTVRDGFELTSRNQQGAQTRISGNSVTWPTGERIEMTGNVKASLPSGWKLEAERLTWDPDQGLLESSGSARAGRAGTSVSGDSLRYQSENQKLVVVDGRITEEED